MSSLARLEKLRRLVSKSFPSIDVSIAYGSGAIPQHGYSSNEKRMVDFIFAVKDSEQWHKENLKLNSNHYSSFAKILGNKKVSEIQRNYGAQIYYNVGFEIDDEPIKYGVIELEDLLNDLNDWKTLYVSGRLQKPTLLLEDKTKPTEFNQSQNENLKHAIAVALSLIPSEKFNEMDLFNTITSISYQGDVRMKVGAENKNKIGNIVGANLTNFKELYEPFYSTFNLQVSNTNTNDFKIDSKTRLGVVVSHLPNSVKSKVLSKNVKTEEQLRSVVSDSISEIVSQTTTSQTLKGLFSSGVFESISYASRKLLKGFKSK